MVILSRVVQNPTVSDNTLVTMEEAPGPTLDLRRGLWEWTTIFRYYLVLSEHTGLRKNWAWMFLKY
jgi:hypothetical protein